MVKVAQCQNHWTDYRICMKCGVSACYYFTPQEDDEEDDDE